MRFCCARNKVGMILPVMLLNLQVLIEKIHTHGEGGEQDYIIGQRHTVSRPAPFIRQQNRQMRGAGATLTQRGERNNAMHRISRTPNHPGAPLQKRKLRKNKRSPGNFTSGAIEIEFHTSREPSDCVATYIHTTNIHANEYAPSHN